MPTAPELLLQDVLRLFRGEEPLTEEGQAYLRALPHTKPETALSEKLWLPLLKAIQERSHIRWQGQVRAGEGWVDYLVQGRGNPVAFELKPIHRAPGKPMSLEEHFRRLLAREREGRNQVKDYLRDFEYVVLTNLVEYQAYNREALVDFRPFAQGGFADLYREMEEGQDPWEALRRLEDRLPRRDLDRRFYEDLRRWYARLAEVRFREGVSSEEAAEALVLLLNKFVFAQTLEDHALIPFRFLRDTYQEAHRRWSPKGPERVAAYFLEEVDRWFYAFYDTELFQTEILPKLSPETENQRAFLQALEEVLGLGAWQATFGLGLVHYNYRAVDEDVFGKAYETFLAQNRKEGGIYYTPSPLTALTARLLAEEVLWPRAEVVLRRLEEGRFPEAVEAARELLQVAFLDPAVGSGSFLIKLLREVLRVYAFLEEHTRWAEELREGLFLPEAQAKTREGVLRVREVLGLRGAWVEGKPVSPRFLAQVVLRHLLGVDLDARALDVARVNLWKEAIKLAPRAFHYSGLGSSGHALPDLRLNLVQGDSLLSPPREEVLKALEPWAREIAELHALRGAYLHDPLDHASLEEALRLKARVRERVSLKGTLLELEFFWLFFGPDGKPVADGGPHGLVGNPPWENVKPFQKEYAARWPEFFGESFSKFALDDETFTRLFREALSQEAFRRGWEAYQKEKQCYREFIRKRYPLVGGGDPSLQKAFLARALELSREAVALLVPSNFHTDLGAKPLREAILLGREVRALYGFENRQGFFPDVDDRFKFDLLLFRNDRPPRETFPARFYAQGLEDLRRAFPYPLASLKRFSPEALSLVEFRTRSDLSLAQAIRGDHPLLAELGYELAAGEFHMTRNKPFFRRAGQGLWPLLEGKHIHQYTHGFAPPERFVDPKEAEEELLRRELTRLRPLYAGLAASLGYRESQAGAWVEEQLALAEGRFRQGRWRLPHRFPRLAWRDVARSTDERTLIAARVPPEHFLGNTLNFFRPYRYRVEGTDVVQEPLAEGEVYWLLALLNSFVLDYYIRLRVSAHVNQFYLKELPLPQVDPSLKAEIAAMAKELEALRLGSALPEDVRVKRAALEAFLAREVFRLTRCQFARLLSTFRFGELDRELIRYSLSIF